MKNDCEVYRDDRYVLGREDGHPFIEINGETYKLTCHPYEPCLYITDKNGGLTAVHNAFDPSSVLQTFSEGGIITSITGTEYDAEDFCRMIEYAAGKYDLQIDDAETVFCGRAKKKAPKTAEKKIEPAVREAIPCGECGRVIEDDPFYGLIAEYPDCVIDWCLVKNESAATGQTAHRQALLSASCKLFTDGGRAIWRFDAAKADAKKILAEELFASAEKMNYRKAFLCPPYPNGYTDADFGRINAALFPNGTDALEAYEWSTDWSEYFDEGHEWWGTLCCTVYDKSLNRFAVIMASATD